LGAQQFTEVGQEMGVAGAPMYYELRTTNAWIDFDNDGLLDLAVFHPGHFLGDSVIPKRYTQIDNLLFKNTGDGFIDVAAEVNAQVGPGLCWGARWADYNLDGWIDFFVVNGTSEAFGAPESTLFRW